MTIVLQNLSYRLGMYQSPNLEGLSKVEQVNFVLHNLALIPKCDQLNCLLQDATFKDANLLPIIVGNIFGTASVPDWGLKTLNKSRNQYEYEAVKNFLSAKGIFLKFVIHLCSDPGLKFDYPVNLLPVYCQKIFSEGGIPPFFVDKVSSHNSGKHCIESVSLNTFEFYFFHFAYYVLNPSHPVTYSADILYNELFEEYLHIFIPEDVYSTYVFGNVLKPQSIMDHSFSDSQSSFSNEDFPSHVLVSIFAEFWLNIQSRSQVQNIKRMEFFEVVNPPLASQHQVYLIRLLIKHIHHFVGHNHLDLESRIGHYKRSIWYILQKYFYQFLKTNFNFWPMDGSFRLLVELWLSVIQPWRYSTYSKESQTRVIQQESVILDSKWSIFVCNNLALYSEIFHCVLNRMMHMDTTSPKNAFVLFRISKVLAIPYLSTLIENAEKSVYKQSSLNNKGISFVSECPFLFMFTPETKLKVGKLIQILASSHQSLLQNQLYKRDPVLKQSFLSWLKNLVWSDLFINENQDDANILVYINLTIQNFCYVFQLVCPNTNIQKSSLYDNFPSLLTSSVTMGEISHQERLHLFHKSHPNAISYHGNPDLLPASEKEFTFLVRFFYMLSCLLNEKFGSTLENFFFEHSFRGSILRQILQPPTTYSDLCKEKSGKSIRQVHQLPPRISLRTWAQIPTITLLLISYGICFVFGIKFMTFFFLVLILQIFIILFKSLWNWSYSPEYAFDTSS